jgi:perosamine synthetase
MLSESKIIVPLSSPDISELEISYVTDVLRTPNLSLGPKLVEFEEMFAEYVGTAHAIATNSGTTALHLIIKSLDIKDGDEVITTPFSFIATSNCILYDRARPVFVDINPLTLNIDVSRIAESITQKTKAILAVDVFGYPAQWDILEQITQEHNLKLIEDSCEALGAEYMGKKAGVFGDAAVFSFYPNKQMTTGEGGMITTNDADIAHLCRTMRNHGRDRDDRWQSQVMLGYNYRLSDINCAIGIAQMKRIETLLSKREHVSQMYRERLESFSDLRIPYSSPGVNRSWFVYVVILEDIYTGDHRNRLLDELKARGIGCSDYFQPIHLKQFYIEMFGYKKGDFPVAEHISERTVALPFHSNLSENEIDFVVENLKDAMSKIR